MKVFPKGCATLRTMLQLKATKLSLCSWSQIAFNGFHTLRMPSWVTVGMSSRTAVKFSLQSGGGIKKHASIPGSTTNMLHDLGQVAAPVCLSFPRCKIGVIVKTHLCQVYWAVLLKSTG